jgi:hypothetical protein
VTWVPTLADAERWVAEKEAVKAIYACRPLVERMWRRSDEYKAIQKAKQAQRQQEKMRRAMEREARERDAAERTAKYEKRQANLAAQKVERERLAARARRSRIDWSELIDNPVTVERQVRWERQTTALAMRKAGLTYREIGERMGMTGSNARILVWRAESRKPGAVSPAEAFMNADLHKEVMDLVPREVATMRAIKPFQYHALAGFGG